LEVFGVFVTLLVPRAAAVNSDAAMGVLLLVDTLPLMELAIDAVAAVTVLFGCMYSVCTSFPMMVLTKIGASKHHHHHHSARCHSDHHPIP
jgi:hypothetical protein